MITEVFEKLRSLQEILSQKFEIEQEIKEIPRVLATKQELLNRLKKTYIEKSQKQKTTEQKIKDLRDRMLEAEMGREKFEKQMDLIKTQREYEALDKEIKIASEKEQELRRELQKEESFLEEVKSDLIKEEKMIQEQENEVEAEKARIEEEIQERKDQLKKLQEKEQEIAPGLDEEILFKFERIIRSKSGVGIVPILNEVCTGCHMILPAQFVNDIKESRGIMFCPYCSRILFASEEEDVEVTDSMMKAFWDENSGDKEEEE